MHTREQEIALIVGAMEGRLPGETNEELAGRIVDAFSKDIPGGNLERHWLEKAWNRVHGYLLDHEPFVSGVGIRSALLRE